MQNNIYLEDGLQFAETAISSPFFGQSNFATLSTKAAILGSLGRTEEMAETMMLAVEDERATPLQIHNLGRQLIASGENQMALKVFEINHERFDGAWPTEVGMARGLSAVGNYDEALKHARIALEQAPDEVNRENLKNAIDLLKNDTDIN